MARPSVKIEWLDSACVHGWMNTEEALEIARSRALTCRTTAILMLDEADRVAIVRSTGDRDEPGDERGAEEMLIIPRCAILRMEKDDATE